MVGQKLGQSSGLARVHAMKLYAMAGASRSAVQIGQEVVDEFIEHGLIEEARQLVERDLLPAVRHYGLVDLLVPIRGQYAVVLAWQGNAAAARVEMAAIEAYDTSPQRRREIQNQRTLIEEIAAGRLRLPPRTPPR
jgi:hypothetical protein